jgi:hypothetical protein
MNTQHTPGPWRVSGKATINAGRSWIASVSTSNRDANARLIAAAPDLLAAAQGALNYIENTESELGITLYSGDWLRAAIAKATGQ